MTEAEFIAKIEPQVPRGRYASEEVLFLVTAAIKAFPASAELWLLHGRVIMAAAEAEVAGMAGRSFEMAIKIDPSMIEAQNALNAYRKSAQPPA